MRGRRCQRRRERMFGNRSLARYRRASAMTDQSRRPNAPDVPDPTDRPGLEKDPEDWVTGDEPMTGAQASYLGTLGRRTGEDVPDELTKAEASEKIDELRDKAGSDPR